MAVWPYGTAQWQRLRKAKLAEQPICQICAARDRTTLANHVDHVRSIASGGDPFPGLDGLRALCASCHSIKTDALDKPGGKGIAVKGCDEHGMPLDTAHPFTSDSGEPAYLARARERSMPLGLRPSRIPLVFVCGPPGSGKSTYAAENAGPRDLVIDLDVIRAGLARTPIHQSSPQFTGLALYERNRLLMGLCTNHRHDRAWFVFGGAKASVRQHWAAMLVPAETVILRPPEDECLRRIRADPARKGQEDQMAAWVSRWFIDHASDREEA